MLYERSYQSKSMTITNIQGKVMTSGDYAEYLYDRFPYELNDLTSLRVIYPSLIVEIYHMRMPLKATKSRCQVLNALIALWPGKKMSDVAVVEFKSIQHAYSDEPDCKQCKRILMDILASEWNVHFKGKELIVS